MPSQNKIMQRIEKDPEEIFDPTLAAYPTRRVAVSAVVDLLHVHHNAKCIEQYRRAMQRGDRFPPVSVLHVARVYLVADGHKRLTAYMSLSANEIIVEVWTIRRWLRDQYSQYVFKTRQQCHLLALCPVDPRARAGIMRLVRDTLAHWKRVATSLLSLRRARIER